MSTNETSPRAPRTIRIPGAILLAGLAAVCVCACWLGIVAGRPFVLANRMRQDNAKVERRLMEMRMDTQSMRKDVAALSSELGMEREARRRGYVKGGEQRLLILPPPK